MDSRLAPDRFSWEREIRASDLPSTAKLCAFVLATFMDKGGGACFPARQTVADGMGMSLRSAQRAFADLEDAGYLHRERRGGRRSSGAYKTSQYVPMIPLGPKGDTDGTPDLEGPPKGDTGDTANDVRGDNDDVKGDTGGPIPSHKTTKSAGYERWCREARCELERMEGSDLCAEHHVAQEFDAVEVPA